MAASFGGSHFVNGIDALPLERGVLGAKRAPPNSLTRESFGYRRAHPRDK